MEHRESGGAALFGKNRLCGVHRVRTFTIRSAAAVAAGLALALPSPALAHADKRARHRPNVLFIIADQWRADAFGHAGNHDVLTPVFDKFVGEGIRFSNAVATIPVCTPSRAALLTGKHGLTTGMFMNDVPLDPAAITLPDMFARAGYDTGFIGKWHVDGHGRSAFIPSERRHSFKYWRGLECTHDYNSSPYYADNNQEKKLWTGYDADAQTSDAIQYMRSVQSSRRRKPFFLLLSWGPPHEPYQTAPSAFRKLYNINEISLRPNVPAGNAVQTRKDLAGYYAHCTALDTCMGRLLHALKQMKISQDTLVVFTSDHGDMIGSHGSEKKQQPWDESCRVPLFMQFSGRFGKNGRELPATITTEDIMPTVLRLSGITPPSDVQGLDFSRYIQGAPDPSDGSALVLCPAPFGQWARGFGGKEYRAIRTDRYTYARDLNGPWLLFDNQADPYQMNNLVNKAGYSDLQNQLDARLMLKLRQTNDRFESADAYIKKWGYHVDVSGTVPYAP